MCIGSKFYCPSSKQTIIVKAMARDVTNACSSIIYQIDDELQDYDNYSIRALDDFMIRSLDDFMECIYTGYFINKEDLD